MKFNRYICFVLFVCLIFSSLTPSLFAVDQKVISNEKSASIISDETVRSDQKRSILNPIAVISSRLPSFKTALSEVPANVTYKSKNDLDRVRPKTVQEGLQDIEGAVFFDTTGNKLDTTFSLRGFAEGSAVTVLVDGVKVNEVDGDTMNYPLIPIYDVDSIQVERGSVSPIYGSGAFGGVVNITTRKAYPALAHFFGGTEWSSFSSVRFHQGLSGTVPDKVTAYEGNVTYYFDMGRDLSRGFRNNDESRITFLNFKGGYDLPDESGGIHAGIKHAEDALSLPGELTLDQFHNDPHGTNKQLDGRDFKNTIIQIDANKKFLNDKLTASALAYWRLNWIHFFSTFATFATAFPTQMTTVRSHTADFISQLSYQDEWKGIGTKSEIGMEFQNAAESDVRQSVQGGNVVETVARGTDRGARPFDTALFWRETLDFFERFSIYGGMRHDFSWAQIKDHLNPANDYSRRWRKSTVSTGAVVHPVKWWDLFGNYSQGFRVPAISEINSFNSDLNASLEPEKSDSYEVGTRLRYKDLAQYKTSIFLIDVADEIVFDSTAISPPANPFGRNVNAGKTRRYGIENRIEGTPIPEFFGYFSYTWMKAFITEAPNGGTPFNDRDLGLIPRSRFTMGTTITPLHRFGQPLDGFKIGLDGFFTGEQKTESYESTSQALINAVNIFIKPYSVWNFTTSFKWKDYEIYFKVNNIFGEKYYSRARASSSSGGIYPAGNYLFVTPGAPREFLVGATWEFGN